MDIYTIRKVDGWYRVLRAIGRNRFNVCGEWPTRGEAQTFIQNNMDKNTLITGEGDALCGRRHADGCMGDQDYRDCTCNAPSVPDKRTLYRTAWTLVGGYAFTSQECVAVRYIGLGQYRINETAETLHECHLTDFSL